MKDTMVELEKFDNLQVIKKERENQRIKMDLEQCQKDLKPTPPTPTISPEKGKNQLLSLDFCVIGHS